MRSYHESLGADLGELLYEFSDAKLPIDAPAKGWQKDIKRRLSQAYFIAVLVALCAWLIVSLVLQSIRDGFWWALLNHLSALFGLFVGGVVLLLSAFSAWGKFVRFAFRKELVNTNRRDSTGASLRALQEDVIAADAQKAEENAFRMYPKHFVVINKGRKITVPRSEVKRADCVDYGTYLELTLHTDIPVRVYAEIPSADRYLLRRHIGNVNCRPAAQAEAREKLQKPARAPHFVVFGVMLALGGLLFALHFTVTPQLPLMFPIVVGAMSVPIFLTAFQDFAIVKYGLLGLVFGIIFSGIPVGVLFSAAEITGASAVSLLLPFTIVHAVLGVFFGVGLMLLIVGIAGVFRILRDGRK